MCVCTGRRGVQTSVGEGSRKGKTGSELGTPQGEAISSRVLWIIPPWTPSLPISGPSVLAFTVIAMLEVQASTVLSVQRSMYIPHPAAGSPGSQNISGPQVSGHSRKSLTSFCQPGTNLGCYEAEEGFPGDHCPAGRRGLIADDDHVLSGQVPQGVSVKAFQLATLCHRGGPRAGLRCLRRGDRAHAAIRAEALLTACLIF